MMITLYILIDILLLLPILAVRLSWQAPDHWPNNAPTLWLNADPTTAQRQPG